MKNKGLVKRTIGGVWFVKWGEIMGGLQFVVCMGNEVENRSMMTHDKTNERWEL